MHKLGVLLHFGARPELENVMFLNPRSITEEIESKLEVQSLHITQADRKTKLAALEAELAPLEAQLEALSNN